MVVLELFSGTGSISKAFRDRGHKCYRVDWNREFQCEKYIDIGKLTANKVLKLCGCVPDVIWASPDCTTYSVAGIGNHRVKNRATGELDPISDYARQCDKTNRHVLDLINELKPRLYFIENPVGGLRKMDFMRGLYRYTVTYCQYGDFRQKPTDIWTNHPDPQFKPACHKGDPCHEPSPRHSWWTGTQKLAKVDRSRIPDELCTHIVDICEELLHG